MNARRRPLRRFWVDVDGLPIHTRASFDPAPDRGPPVVLVHGLGVSTRYLMPTAELLAADYRVLAPDLPGFGRSGKPARALDVPELAEALAAWMRAIGLDRAAFLGNSLGCQILAELAVRHPERVDRLIFQGPTVDARHRTLPRQLLFWLMDAPHEAPSQGLILLADYADCGVGRVFRTIGHALRDRIEEKLPRIEAPTLVIRGSNDPMCPDRWVEEVARMLPRGRLRVIPGGGHTMVYSMPLEVVRVCRPFLDEPADRSEVRRAARERT